jgi:hypothetical protein
MIVFYQLTTALGRICRKGWLALVPALLCCVSVAAVPAHAQTPRNSQPSQQDLRREALDWLDQYLTNQVLLKREDMTKIRQTVSQMSPSQLEDWLTKTQELRAYLESDAWQDTNNWLREFLRVQAIYSDEEIEELKEKIAAADPAELLEILEDIQRKHSSLRSMHRASDQNRSASLKARDATIKQQQAAAKAARKSSGGSRPLFGNSQGGAANKYTASKGYRPPRPLITSRQVARGVVARQVYGGWGGRGW